MAEDLSRSDDAIADIATRAATGDEAAKKALFAALYDELHRLAEAHIRKTGGPLTLSATTLLHEAYLDLAQRDPLAFPDRNRFLGYASRAMRGLIIDYVRERTALKRGGDLTFTPLVDQTGVVNQAINLDALDTALKDLATLDPSLAELVDLKFFCGFSVMEIAAMRGVSDRTIQRDWAKARTLLHQSLHDE